MRLTLRTLLSYLDDTLDPAQTKIIGAKVADSEQARDLAERIKQVTRRRRLTTPPTSGPGGIDANTIAEYLDNDVTPETAAEVEQICLASDVHLAEVAACHQILTLVLGEPALVPPSAKQRMYGLVKGPEAIPFRRAARPAKDDNDLSSELEPDHDDSLRLGVPAIGSGKDRRNLFLLIGGGVLAACCLGLAIYMLVGHGGGPVEPNKGDQIAQDGGKDKGKEHSDIKTDDKKQPSLDNPKKVDLNPPPEKEPKDKDAEQPFVPKVETVKVGNDAPKTVEIAYAPASTKQIAIGQQVPAPAKEPASLLQFKSPKVGWTRVIDKDVLSARPLLALPGTKSTIALNSGVEVTLWGNLAELTFNPFLAESRALLHANDLLDADITMQRGRLLVRNGKKGDKDALVRVRFDNPTLPRKDDPARSEEEHFDLVLRGGAAVVFERYSTMDQNEQFYDDPKDPDRLGPTATMWVFAYGGSANIRCAQVAYALEQGQQPILRWDSRQGTLTPPDAKLAPPAPPATPPALKEKGDQLVREKVLKARAEVESYLEKNDIAVALAEMMQSVQKSADRDTTAGKQILPDTYIRWQYVIRCYAATDDADSLFRDFAANPTPLQIRGLYMQALQQWLTNGREYDYLLLDVVRKNYRKTESLNILSLFHPTSAKDALKPETYEHLIENLNNDLLPIRALSHMHLFVLVPEGRKIFYDPAVEAPIRMRAVREWLTIVPPGKLPPGLMPPTKKDKEKSKG